MRLIATFDVNETNWHNPINVRYARIRGRLDCNRFRSGLQVQSRINQQSRSAI